MPHDGLTLTERGFTYDVDRIDDELGMIEENGIRLLHDRRNGVLRVERIDPTIEQIIEDLEAIR